MDYCYTRDMKVKPPNYALWSWREAQGDFAYPMSLDGHFFNTEDILPLLSKGKYSNPNQLEAYLAKHPINKELMICGKENAVINNPNNRVQDVYPNRSENGDLDAINKLFLQGKRIDIRPYLKAKYNAPHVPIKIVMI